MQQEVLIRKNRSLLKGWVIALTLAVVLFSTMVINDYLKTGVEGVWYGIFFIALFLALLIYFGRELYNRNVELKLSDEGMYLRNKGLYPWEFIKSFSTLEYEDSDVETLVLHTENNGDVRFNIDGLEKKSSEIIELILACKGASAVNYNGHYKK